MAKKPTKKAKAATAGTPATAKADLSLLTALLKATGEPAPKEGESLKDVCYRIFLKVPSLADDVFAALPEPVRTWYDKNTDLFNSEQFDKLEALPGMPGAFAAAESTSTAAQGASPATPPPATPAAAASTPQPNEENSVQKGKKDKKTAAAKPAAKPAEAKERAPRTDSLAYKIRIAVVKKPSISFEDAAAAAGVKKAEATSSSHAFNYYNHARVVLAMFMEHRKIEK